MRHKFVPRCPSVFQHHLFLSARESSVDTTISFYAPSTAKSTVCHRQVKDQERLQALDKFIGRHDRLPEATKIDLEETSISSVDGYRREYPSVIHNHLQAEDEFSVLTMDPSLVAINKRTGQETGCDSPKRTSPRSSPKVSHKPVLEAPGHYASDNRSYRLDTTGSTYLEASLVRSLALSFASIFEGNDEEEQVEDGIADDLSEIAPLDLVSL